MLFSMVSWLLDVVVGGVAGTCLLRLAMQRQRVPFQTPLGRFVFAVTDWVVLPLRRLVPPVGGWDWASLLAAWLLKAAQVLLLSLWLGGAQALARVPLASVWALAQLTVSALSALVLVHALLSWVQPGSPMDEWTRRLARPWLAPVQRRLPLVGGVDLSPLVVLLLLQLLGMALAGWAP